MLGTVTCRIFQAAMKLGNYFVGYRTPQCVEGIGSIAEIPELLKNEGISRALVVTDENILSIGLADGMLSAIEREKTAFCVFSDIQSNPTDADVERGVVVYKEQKCDGIIAFGGGSPMDCAKAIGARIARPRKSVMQMQGTLRVRKRIPTLITVPTTSGTGSETTVAAVITQERTHHKASINDPCLIPRYAVLDPALTVGLNPFTTATTGMDALCHAVEAYTNHKYNTSLENKLAVEAVRLVYENLLTAYKDGNSIEARQSMQKAAFFAGRAFTRGCVGYVHAVGHTLSGLYGVPHGLAMAVILPHVMRQYGSAVYKRLAVLADACSISGADMREKALNFILWIEQLKREMDIPETVDMIKDEDIPQIIEWAMAEANPLYPVPVVWGEDDFRALIGSIMAH